MVVPMLSTCTSWTGPSLPLTLSEQKKTRISDNVDCTYYRWNISAPGRFAERERDIALGGRKRGVVLLKVAWCSTPSCRTCYNSNGA